MALPKAVLEAQKEAEQMEAAMRQPMEEQLLSRVGGQYTLGEIDQLTRDIIGKKYPEDVSIILQRDMDSALLEGRIRRR